MNHKSSHFQFQQPFSTRHGACYMKLKDILLALKCLKSQLKYENKAIFPKMCIERLEILPAASLEFVKNAYTIKK